MDKMYICGLDIYAYHGVFKEEKERGQRFIIDVTLELDLSKSGETDALNDTVSYADVCDLIEKVMQEKKCDLIEHAATRICTAILASFDKVQAVTIKLMKPQAPVESRISYAAVELRRER